jgi:hypothetical protein
VRAHSLPLVRQGHSILLAITPQDFTGLNTDTGNGITELKSYIAAVRDLRLPAHSKEKILSGTAVELLRS